ncbi:MAG: porin family protein [Dysgonomonas sp.]
MRKFLLLIFFSIFFSLLKAQSDFKPEWNVGVGFGPTFSSMSFKQPSVTTKNYQQYFGGFSIRYITEKNLGLLAELNLSQQGWKGDYKDQPQFKHSHSLTYIELPIMTHIYFGRKVRFFVNLGPKFQFLIGEKESMSQELEEYLVDNSTSRDIQYNREAEHKFDYGILAGGGLEFRTGIGNFSLEGRYYFGLGDIFETKKSPYNFSRSANRTISAKLTYYVKLF